MHHFSLELSDLEGFTGVRERLLARAATPGVVTDFGDRASLFFSDPDGYLCELTLRKPSDWHHDQPDPPARDGTAADPIAYFALPEDRVVSLGSSTDV